MNTSTSDENFWFRFYVKDETKQLQPQANDDPVTVTAAGASTSVYTNTYEGSSNAWKTTFDKSAYDKLTIYLDIATPRRLWIVGSKNSVVTEKKFVLVDNNGAEVSENTTGSFVYNLTNATADAVVSFKIDGAAYGLTAPANITAAGTTFYTATKGATGTLTLAKGLKYDITIADVLIGEAPSDGTFSDGDQLGFSLRKRSTDVTYRYYGLGNYHRTKFYKENQTGDDYIGFFRLTPQGRSGANKAYLRMPAKKELDGGAFGFIENNSQFIGANDETSASLAKMMIVFDDEMGGVTEIKHVEVEKNADNAYYTLQGVKVLRPTKGIFIHNGKKIVIK